MIMGYYRVGAYDEARRSMQHILTFARKFRMDNPLVEFGAKVYQPKEPINLCYDTFGPPAALVRGLFEYLYKADGLTILPHIPPGITRLEQRFPIRFGTKKLYLATVGAGPVTSVRVNGEKWSKFNAESVFFPYHDTPDSAFVRISLGDEKLGQLPVTLTEAIAKRPPIEQLPGFKRVHAFYTKLVEAGLGDCYEAQHARLAMEYAATFRQRRRMLEEGTIEPLPEPSQSAAHKSYAATVKKLRDGLETVLESYADSTDPHTKRLHQLWLDSAL
jgi:hypothetical protein